MKKIIFFAALIYLKITADCFANFSSSANLDSDIKPGILKQIIEVDNLASQGNESTQPNFVNRLVFDFNNENYRKNGQQNEGREITQNNSRWLSSWQISENFKLNSFVNFTQNNFSNDARANDYRNKNNHDQFFDDHGAFFEELNLSWKHQNHTLVVGKYDLNFGSAWRWNRGIWNHEISQLYQEREKIGVQEIYSMGSAKRNGLYQFGLGFFKNDRKYLDNSVFASRTSSAKNPAKAGDDSWLNSYIASLDIALNFADKEKVSYHFSYVNSSLNSRNADANNLHKTDQKKFAANMNYFRQVDENLSFDGLVEYVKVRALDGNSNLSDRFLTTNLVTTIYKNWDVVLGYSQRRFSDLGQSKTKQNLGEISFGYNFLNSKLFDKLTIQAGVKKERDNSSNSFESRTALGVLLRYQKIL